MPPRPASQIPPTLHLDALQRVAQEIQHAVLHTAQWHNEVLSEQLNTSLYLKMENLQRAGSFKIRGATNKLRKLLRAQADVPGVVACSAGNHAQGVARAARLEGLPATVVMPENAPLTKVQSCRQLGAELVMYGDTLEAARTEADRIAAARGYAFIHPYDDEDIIAGQASCGLEMLADCPDMTHAIVPLGGGGLLAGIALALKQQRPSIRVIGVQTEAVAPYRHFLRDGSLETPPPGAHTIADGIKVKAPGRLNAPLIAAWVDEILTVDDNAIAEAMLATLERTRTMAEGAGAVGLAAVLSGKLRLAATDRAVVVISGGNTDTTLVGRVLDYGLACSGRLMSVAILISDSPGKLLGLLASVAALGINVRHVEHRRGELHVPVGHTEVLLQMETRDLDHQRQLLDSLAQEGLRVRQLSASGAL